MAEYTYGLVVDGLDTDCDDVVDRLDEYTEVVLLGSSDGITTVYLSIDAESPSAAAWVGIELIERVVHGAVAVRIDLDLVAAADIADRVDVSRQAVNQWAGGRRSGDPFPDALGVVAHGTRVWSWSQVYPWLITHGHTPEDMPPLPVDVVTSVNAKLLAGPVAGSASAGPGDPKQALAATRVPAKKTARAKRAPAKKSASRRKVS